MTGANSGLGKATALAAARPGADVRMLSRGVERGEAVRREISPRYPEPPPTSTGARVPAAGRCRPAPRGPGTARQCTPGGPDTPGLQSALPGLRRLARPILRSAREGADTSVWLLAAPEGAGTTGLFWHDRTPRRSSYLSRTEPTPEQIRWLWDQVVEATGVPRTG